MRDDESELKLLGTSFRLARARVGPVALQVCASESSAPRRMRVIVCQCVFLPTRSLQKLRRSGHGPLQQAGLQTEFDTNEQNTCPRRGIHDPSLFRLALRRARHLFPVNQRLFALHAHRAVPAPGLEEGGKFDVFVREIAVEAA